MIVALPPLLLIVVIAISDFVHGIQIRGGGSSLAAPLYNDATLAYSLQSSSSDVIMYTSSSSGTGRTLLAAGELDFADSDSVLTPSYYQQNPSALCIPVLAAAIVPIFNLPSMPSLQLTQHALAKIFLGEIVNWNDTEIRDSNVDTNYLLPNASIRVIVRADASGTTGIFTSALSAFYQPFNETIGTSELPNFTAPLLYKASGNEGVADKTVSLPYSISYTTVNIATDQAIPFASVQNTAGYFIAGSSASVLYALYERAVLTLGASGTSALPGPSGNSISLVDPTSARAYPIAGFSYAIVFGNSSSLINDSNCDRRNQVLQFLLFMLYSPVVATLATNDNFNSVPDLFRQALNLDTVLTTEIYCPDGTLAVNYQATNAVTVSSGSGAQLGVGILSRLTTSYTSIVTGIGLAYTGSSSSAAVSAISSSMSPYSYGVVLNDELSDAQISSMADSVNGVIQLPLAIVPVLPVFELSGIANISLTVDIIGQMYSGLIQYWDDPLIQSLNPNLGLPHQSVILTSVLPSSAVQTVNEATSIFVSSLFDLSPSFAACFESEWRTNAQSFIFRDQALSTCATFNQTNWVYALSEAAIQGLVSNTIGTIGYTILTTNVEASPVFLNNISLSVGQMSSCLTDGGSSDTPSVSFTVSPRSSTNSSCWPMASTLSIILPALNYDQVSTPGYIKCAQVSGLAEFLIWQASDSKGLIAPAAESLGLYWLGSTSSSTERETYDILYAQFMCNGSPVLSQIAYAGTILKLSQSVPIQCVGALLCFVGAWVALLLIEMVTIHTNYNNKWSLHFWILMTSVSLAVTAMWTAMVLTYSSLSLECPSCDANIQYNSIYVVMSAVVAVVPVYIGLTILHWNYMRITAASDCIVYPVAAKNSSQSNSNSSHNRITSNTNANNQYLLRPTFKSILQEELKMLYRSSTWISCVGSAFIAASIAIIRVLLNESLEISVANVSWDDWSFALSSVVCWFLSIIAMSILFHGRRWRLIGVLVFTGDVVLMYEASFNAMTVTYQPSVVTSVTAAVSSNTLIIIAAVIGACSGLIFVALQFNKLQVSHHALLKRSRALTAQLQLADKQRKRDERIQSSLTQYISLAHHIMDTITLWRPSDSLAATNDIRIEHNMSQLIANSSIFQSGQQWELTQKSFEATESAEKSSDKKLSIPANAVLQTVVQTNLSISSTFSTSDLAAPSSPPGAAHRRAVKAPNSPPTPHRIFPSSPTVARESLPSIPSRNSSSGVDAPHLDAILSHPLTAELLKDAAQRSLNIENVMFLLWFDRYAKATQGANVNDQRELAQIIFNQFIRDKSPLEVNLSARLRAAVAAQLELRLSTGSHRPINGVLEEARREVVGLTMTNVWPSFIQSRSYVQCGLILRASSRMSERLRLSIMSATSNTI